MVGRVVCQFDESSSSLLDFGIGETSKERSIHTLKLLFVDETCRIEQIHEISVYSNAMYVREHSLKDSKCTLLLTVPVEIERAEVAAEFFLGGAKHHDMKTLRKLVTYHGVNRHPNELWDRST